jgi:hypothetical protein
MDVFYTIICAYIYAFENNSRAGMPSFDVVLGWREPPNGEISLVCVVVYRLHNNRATAKTYNMAAGL